MDSAAVYELVATVLRGAPTTARQRRRAFSVPVERWERILGFDGCAVQFNRALHRAGAGAEIPPRLRRLLRDATGSALRQGLLVHAQMTEVAALCADAGLRAMALKGAARLLAGELPGVRSIADIDLLAAPQDATRLHELLQRRLGYAVDGDAYPHHLAGLTRPGSLGIEVHVRLTPTVLPLDAEIWHATRQVMLDGHAVELPTPTDLLLHTLEHAVRVNWTARYRLRDVLDVGALYSPDVDDARVIAHVAASDCRRPMRTVLAAARALHPRIPFEDDGAWRTVERVGRTRIALAALPRTPRVAERFFRYAGMLAEGSPRTIGRAGFDLARRLAGRAAAVVALAIGLASCDAPVAPKPLVITPFIFASETGGTWALYRFRDGVVTRLSTPGSDDREPQSVGSLVVFTSLRDGDAEIYSATLNGDLTLGAQTRLTDEYGTDAEPALNPSGATIAFVSGRGGTPRVWLMDATGANPRPLDTGSADYVPEEAPRWSPSGDRILFTSTRTGTSQVFVVASAGGVATQLSHETRGAFSPSWLPDGRSVLFTAVSGTARVLSVPATGGDATAFATDSAGIGEATCSPALCLAVSGTLGSSARVVALTATGRASGAVVPQVADDHHPALLLAP